MKAKIDELLREHNLSHFTYFEEASRIIYTHESGTSQHLYDFQRLLELLKENGIKHEDIGIDVILIHQE